MFVFLMRNKNHATLILCITSYYMYFMHGNNICITSIPTLRYFQNYLYFRSNYLFMFWIHRMIQHEWILQRLIFHNSTPKRYISIITGSFRISEMSYHFKGYSNLVTLYSGNLRLFLSRKRAVFGVWQNLRSPAGIGSWAFVMSLVNEPWCDIEEGLSWITELYSWRRM